MTFLIKKNGIKEKHCPVRGKTLTIKTRNGKILVDSNFKDAIYEKSIAPNT